MIDRWGLKSFQKKYQIIYFATHGTENTLHFGREKITLDAISERLEGKCERAIFYFGSCQTLNIHKTQLNRFLKKTKALGVIGYKSNVDWLLATSMEILALSYLQYYPFSTLGIDKMENKIRKDIGQLAKGLEFKIVTNPDHYPTKRKKVTAK